MREGYAASVAQNTLPADTAEHTGMVEVPVCFADRTAGFLSVDAFFFKSGHGGQNYVLARVEYLVGLLCTSDEREKN